MRAHRDWTESEEDLIKTWIDDSSALIWLHEKTAASYKKYDHTVTLPVMIITAATGSANVGMAFYDQSDWISNLITGVFGVGSAILTAIGHYYKFGELAETHKQTAYSWNKLRASAMVQLALPYEERAECRTFMDSIKDEMDRLRQSSPQVPEKFIAEYEKRVEKEMNECIIDYQALSA